MKHALFAVAAMMLALLAAPSHANAATCANGVYRAGCAGPNGAAVVQKPASVQTKCAKGVNHAGCAGPNGAAVVGKPPAAGGSTCAWVNGRQVCH